MMFIPFVVDRPVNSDSQAQQHIDQGGIAHHWGENTKLAGGHDYLAFNILDDLDKGEVIEINGKKYIVRGARMMYMDYFFRLLTLIGDHKDIRVLYTCTDVSNLYLFVFLTPYDG